MKGQLALINRGPFCPARDCYVACGAPGRQCTCRPCHCARCATHRARARQRLHLIDRPTPLFRSPVYQPPLFPPTTRGAACSTARATS